MSRTDQPVPPTGSATSQQDLAEMAHLTPFTPQQLRGKRFKSGNMLGGAMPLQANGPPDGEEIRK